MGAVRPSLFIGILFILFFLGPLVVPVRVMVHVHPIKFPIGIVLDKSPPICSIYSDLIPDPLDAQRLNIFHILIITVVWVF